MRHMISVSSGCLLAGCFLLGNSLPALHSQGGKKKVAKLDDLIAIKFGKKKYVFTQAEIAKGYKFTYQIIVRKRISKMLPMRQDSATITSPSNLLPFPKIYGNRQYYGILDVGLGPPIKPVPKTIKKGVYKRTFFWDGRNWSGPSDFGAKKGKPFPPGTYSLNVSMIGKIETSKGTKRYKISKSVPVIVKK